MVDRGQGPCGKEVRVSGGMESARASLLHVTWRIFPGGRTWHSSAGAAPFQPLHSGEQAVWEGQSRAMTSALRTLMTAVDRGYKSRSLRSNRDRANRGACLPQLLTRAQPGEVALIKFKNCFGVELKRSENVTSDNIYSSCMSFDIDPAVPRLGPGLSSLRPATRQ